MVILPDPLGRPGEVLVQAREIGLERRLDELAASHPLAAAIQGVLHTLNLTRLPACTIRITSTIPVASGLGSGAAVSVALIRSLSAFLGRPLPDERVCELAFEIEKLHHGTPSGIDNTVITYAVPIYYVRGRPVERLQVLRPFTMVIGDTGIPSPTAAAVGDLRKAWEADPERCERLFNTAGEAALSARRAIETGRIEELGPLMNANHRALQGMGVSSPDLDRLVEAASSAGAEGAKLSGGGRGGNMLALVKPEAAEAVALALRRAGAVRTIITEVAR